MKLFLLAAIVLITPIVRAQSWSQIPTGYPYNYLQVTDEFVSAWMSYYNPSSTVTLDVLPFQDTVNAPAEVWGDATQAPPWTTKFATRTSEHGTAPHTASWPETTISPLHAREARVLWSTEDGAQTWAQNGSGQVASRTRTWYTYADAYWSDEFQP